MNRTLVALLVLALGGGAAAVACGSSSEAPSSNGTELPPGASRPKDGAPGVCCPVTTGGCAKAGGYSASGECTDEMVCDGMCDQTIVDGDHGCAVLTYTPCGDGGHSSDGGADAGTAPICPIIGDEDDQFGPSPTACRECVATKCCDEVTSCYGGGDDPASTRRADGGYSPCLMRSVCWFDNCSALTDGGGEVGGPCDTAECSPKFDTAVNNLFIAAVTCNKTKCDALPDGGPLCDFKQ